jgi:hypothetical protein
MRKIDVFFYGLFMDEDLLRARDVTVTRLEPAFVTGFELRIGERAALAPAESSRVYGLIASLSHADLEHLYSEPGLKDYKPEAVLAHPARGEISAALCFNLVKPPPASERNPEYAAKLRALAERLHFPADYVASIS